MAITSELKIDEFHEETQEQAEIFLQQTRSFGFIFENAGLANWSRYARKHHSRVGES